MKNAAFIAAIVLLISAAVFMRCWQLTDSLWVDELHTSWVVADGATELTNRAALGNQPPLYFIIVRLSTLSFGETELALRLPSLIASIATVCILGVLAWRISRSRLAVLVTVFIAAIDHELIFYASEARVYALLHLAAVLHIAALLELTFFQKQRLAKRFVKSSEVEFAFKLCAWGATGVLLISLHFLTGVFLAVELAFVMAWVIWRRDSLNTRQWLLPTIGLLALVSIAFYSLQLADIFARRENWRTFISTQSSLVAFAWFVWPIPFYFAIPIALAFGDWLLRLKRNESKQSPHFAIALTILALAPVLCAWVATVTNWLAIFHPRYFAPSLPALLLIPAATFRGVSHRVLRWTMAIIVCVGGLWFNAPFDTFCEHNRFVAGRSENWRSAVAYLNNLETPSPIVIYSGLIEADEPGEAGDQRWREYAALPLRGIYRTKRNVKIYPLPAADYSLSNTAIADLRNANEVVLIVRGSPEFADEVAEDVTASLEHFDRAETRRFGNVSVYGLKGE